MLQKYDSIKRLINLPKKRVLNAKESVFNNKNDLKHNDVSNKLKEKRKEFLKLIEQELEIFDDIKYHFKFPQSKFDDVQEGRVNQMTYELKIEVENENTFKPKLNQKQIEQIKKNGQFQIKSIFLKTEIPYIWKINPYLVKGKINIVESWQNGIAKCYDMFDKARIFVVSTFWKSFDIIGKIPGQLFGLFFGKKSIVKIYEQNCDFEVHIDFWADILGQELKEISNEIGHDFLEILEIKNEQFLGNFHNDVNLTKQEISEIKKKMNVMKNKQSRVNNLILQMRRIQLDFQQNWIKIRKTVIAKIQGQIYEQKQHKINHDTYQSDQEKHRMVLQKVAQQKFLLYTAHVKEYVPKCGVSMKAMESLIYLITILYYISTKLKLKQNKLKQIKRITKESIKKKYTIRSRNSVFLQRETQRIFKDYEKNVNQDFYQHILEDKNIKGLINENYHRIYKKYLNFRKNHEKLKQQKRKEMKVIYKPQMVFKQTYQLFRPYKVDLSLISSGFLKKFQERIVDTNANFWKVNLFLIRLKFWILNCVVVLLKFVWVGLRIVFGFQQFVCDEWYNVVKKQKQYIMKKTCIGHFKVVLKGFYESREKFEQMHDEGLLGKKFSVIFNFIECFLFRLFIFGIIGTLIVYPILILSVCVISVGLIVTVWIWVPLFLGVYYFFTVFVYQVEVSDVNTNVVMFPLFYIFGKGLVNLVKIVFSIINLLILTPLITSLYFIFLVIQKVFRIMGDFTFILIISRVGRTPSKDTKIAKKIAGPGMSRNNYYSILKEDVYVLTQCCLEKILVRKFIELTRLEIEKSIQKYENIMGYVLAPFMKQNQQTCNIRKNIITTNKNSLMQHFNKKARQFQMRYPFYPKMIRFTQSQIDIYFKNSVKIAKNFVEKEQIKDWIFDQRQIIYEDYEELTKSLWIEIFQCGQQIFEPLEMIDSRTQLSNHTQNENKTWQQNVNQVMESLRNQIQLCQSIPVYVASKKSVLQNDFAIKCFQEIFRMNNLSVNNFSNLQVNDPSFLFLAPKNLDALRSEQKRIREQHLKLERSFEI